MKLEGRQLVLDTNILLFWLRGRELGVKIKGDYALGERQPRPIVPVVVKGELLSLALQREWGTAKVAALEDLLRELPTADISHELIVHRYADLDTKSRALGRRMGKNDLWIAAVAAVQNATVLTTDADFDHLHPSFVAVERVAIT